MIYRYIVMYLSQHSQQVVHLIPGFDSKRAQKGPDATIVRAKGRLYRYALARRHATLARHQAKRLRSGAAATVDGVAGGG